MYLKCLILMCSLAVSGGEECLCMYPLGIEDGTIPSDQLTASSEHDHQHGPRRGRLNITPDSDGIGAWAAGDNDLNQWIQADLGALKKVTGVVIQGRNDYNQWVTSYEVLHSVYNNNGFETVMDANGQTDEFIGNSDRDTPVTNMFHAPVYAQFIRIHPTSWNGHISLRFEVLGCSECLCIYPLGVEDGTIPSDQLTASSEHDHQHGPRRGRLNITPDSDGIGAWAAGDNDLNQWIQADLGALKKVTGVVIQGRNDYNQWVTSYEVLHSVYNNNGFETVMDANGQTDEFIGNSDRDTPVTNMFHAPVYAQFIRIHPTSWNGHISLRFEVLGCSGCMTNPCSTGYICTSYTDPDAYCTCPTGYTGDNCTTYDACKVNPCSPGYSCTSYTNPDTYTCTCPDGYLGDECATYNGCLSDPCQNDGTCELHSNPDRYICSCRLGYEGVLCDVFKDPCNDSPCYNNGICQVEGDVLDCVCEGVFTGMLCQDVHVCDNNICNEGGVCLRNGDAQKCYYDEENNNTSVHVCDNNICNEGGVCLINGDAQKCYYYNDGEDNNNSNNSTSGLLTFPVAVSGYIIAVLVVTAAVITAVLFGYKRYNYRKKNLKGRDSINMTVKKDGIEYDDVTENTMATRDGTNVYNRNIAPTVDPQRLTKTDPNAQPVADSSYEVPHTYMSIETAYTDLRK